MGGGDLSLGPGTPDLAFQAQSLPKHIYWVQNWYNLPYDSSFLVFL